MFFGSQPHIYKPSKGEGRLNATFVNLVPMEMAVSFHCVQGCAIGGGKLKWRANGMEKDKSIKRMMHTSSPRIVSSRSCHHSFWLHFFTVVFIIHFLPHWLNGCVLTNPISCWIVPKDIRTYLRVLLFWRTIPLVLNLSWIWVQVVYWASKEMFPGC